MGGEGGYGRSVISKKGVFKGGGDSQLLLPVLKHGS